MPPAIEISDLEDDEDFIIPTDEYSYRAIVQEAKEHYKDTKPDFCVANQSCTCKTVVLSGSDTLTDLEFEMWSDKYGYWTLTDRIDDRYIVKHKGGKFYVWDGVAQGFSREPVALILKNGNKTGDTVSTVSRVEIEHKTSNRDRPLRRRTMRQSMPYTVDKTQMKYDLKGLRLSETELEEATWEATSSPGPALDKVARKKRKARDSSGESVNNSPSRLKSSLTSTTFVRPISHEESPPTSPTLRTRFDGFDDATIPLPKEKCPDHEALFRHIKQKWAFKLMGQEILYCIAAFSWLDASKNLLLQEADGDGFVSMMEEMRRAPMSQQESRTEIVISIFTKKET